MFPRCGLGHEPALHGALLVSTLLAVLARAALASAAAPIHRGEGKRAADSDLWASEGFMDELPRLRGLELQREVPDLVVRSEGPRLGATLGISQKYPLQAVGVDIGINFALVDWFHTHLLYSPGIVGGNGKIWFGNYFETFVGIRVAEMASERAVNVYPAAYPELRDWRERVKPELAAWLPSFHRLFLEVGALSSSVLFGTCFERCSGPEEQRWTRWEARQLLFPLGGLRYVYFIHAVSQEGRRALSRRIQLEVYAHLLGKPVNGPENASLWGNDEDLQRAEFGGRLGVKIPACLKAPCLAIIVNAGYVPVPRSVLFQVGTSN